MAAAGSGAWLCAAVFLCEETRAAHAFLWGHGEFWQLCAVEGGNVNMLTAFI